MGALPPSAASASATLGFSDLETLWTNAGGPASVAPIAAAIALAESGGDPTATNPTDNGGRQTSWGLWQISDGTHNAPAASWSDPTTNAALAVDKYTAAIATGQSGFAPWGTFTSGAYKQFLGTSGTIGGAIGGYATAAGASTPAPAAAASSSTPSGFWAPVVTAAQTIATEAFLGALALALISGGLLWLASSDPSVRAVAQKAATA